MFKRKTIIIDRSFQMRYAGVVIASMLITIILVHVGAMQYKIWFAPPGSSKVIFGFATFLTLIFICLGVLVAVFAIFASHKFAGPIYRFKRTLEAVAEGDLTARAFLRKNDELNDVRDVLNKAIISVQRRVAQDREKAGDVLKRLKNLRQDLSQAVPRDKLNDIVKKIEYAENQLNEISSQFKI